MRTRAQPERRRHHASGVILSIGWKHSLHLADDVETDRQLRRRLHLVLIQFLETLQHQEVVVLEHIPQLQALLLVFLVVLVVAQVDFLPVQ